MERTPSSADASTMATSSPVSCNHCIRVVSASETTGDGWLALSEWMREWAGRSELHLVHIESLDLLGLQRLLERLEFALGQGALDVMVDIGVCQITPAALLSLIAERRHLGDAGINLTLRGQGSLRPRNDAARASGQSGQSGDDGIDESPARALLAEMEDGPVEAAGVAPARRGGPPTIGNAELAPRHLTAVEGRSAPAATPRRRQLTLSPS